MSSASPERLLLAQSVAKFLAGRGDIYVNLGIGIPNLVANFLPADSGVTLQTENGLLGFRGLGPTDTEDPDTIDAGKHAVGLEPGASVFDQATSFAMIRGGHIDVAVLGAFEVSASGDLANWSADGARLSAVGGAMDLAVGAREVYVATTHLNTSGSPKLREECSLPLTGRGIVDLVFTELGTLRPLGSAFELIEIARGVTTAEIIAATAAPVTLPEVVPVRALLDSLPGAATMGG